MLTTPHVADSAQTLSGLQAPDNRATMGPASKLQIVTGASLGPAARADMHAPQPAVPEECLPFAAKHNATELNVSFQPAVAGNMSTSGGTPRDSPSLIAADGCPLMTDSLLRMMADRDSAGQIQNVYYNKSSSAWFFRITFNNKHITFSVAGLGKLDHAVIRECLMAVLQDSTKTNTSSKVLALIAQDISVLQQLGPECPPEKLVFSKELPLYHTFMGRADAWLAKLSKDRGQGQAAAATARLLLAPVSALFLASAVTASPTMDTVQDAEPSPPPRSKHSVKDALQAALEAGALHGVRTCAEGAATAVAAVVVVAGGVEVLLETPCSSLVEAAILRELLIIDGKAVMASQLMPAQQSALSADWNRWKRLESQRASAGSTGGDAVSQLADSTPALSCQDCVPMFAVYSELQAAWSAKLAEAKLPRADAKPKPVPKDEPEQRGVESAMGLLATFSQLPLHLLEKYQPKAGSASSRGKSRLWQELREREADGGLRGVNAHQSSATSFSISIPGFNTTLSRVDKLENAVVSEILIQLTSSFPRNISTECAAMIFQDLEALGAVLADDLNFENVPSLNFMDALPMYRLVLSRLSKWIEQIERRRTSGGSTGAGPGRKRRRMEGAEAPEAGTTYNTRPPRGHADRDDSGPQDSAAADSDEEPDLPSRPESRAANRRAESKPGGLRKPPPPVNAGNGRRWNPESSDLPTFCQVSHVFSDPVGNAKDFEALITILRQCVGNACTSCGERRMWTGVYNRFRSKWVKSMQSRTQMPESIAIYSDIQDFQRQGQFYAIMDAIDSYLCE